MAGTAKWYKSLTSHDGLQQGDLFKSIAIPQLFITDFSSKKSIEETVTLRWNQGTFIILTQSCDLEPDNQKDLGRVVLVPVFTIEQFLTDNPSYTANGDYKNIIANRNNSFHTLQSPSKSLYGSDLLVAVFHLVHLIEPDALKQLARSRGCTIRHRLQNPYVESLSQRFGNLYARVAIPGTFPTQTEKDAVKSAAQVIANRNIQ